MDKKDPIGIIVTHGGLARELIQTAEYIIGPIPFCYAVSNKDLADEALIAKIKEIMEESSPAYAFLFVDYFGSSCSMNCARAARGIDDVVIISGVNLPILLDFVTKRGTMSPDEITKNLVMRGQESVKVIDL